MTDIIANAKQLLDGATPGPWSFQPWSKYTGPNGDYEESTLFDSDGETLCHGLPDSEGELIAAAPELASALAEEVWEYRHEYQVTGSQQWHPLTDWAEGEPDRRPWNITPARIMRRRVSPPEVINE